MIINPFVFGVTGAAQATWNPSDRSGSIDLSMGNRQMVCSNSAFVDWYNARSTSPKTNGKFYVEASMEVNASQFSSVVGLANGVLLDHGQAGADSNAWTLGTSNGSGGNVFTLLGGSYNPTAGPSNLPSGSIAMMAVDLDAGHGWFGAAGSWLGGGDPETDTSPTFTFPTGVNYYIVGSSPFTFTAIFLNAGQDPFTYTPPSGFTAGWPA